MQKSPKKNSDFLIKILGYRLSKSIYNAGSSIYMYYCNVTEMDSLKYQYRCIMGGDWGINIFAITWPGHAFAVRSNLNFIYNMSIF